MEASLTVARGALGTLAWAAAFAPAAGESVCGDHHVVLARGEVVVAAVIDGLGHGAEAASAAACAARALAASTSEDAGALLARCHDELKTTRGAAISLATIAPDSMSWIGVGNVDGLLVRAAHPHARERLLSWGGVVGHTMPRARASRVAVHPGDLLVFTTDGVPFVSVDRIVPTNTPEATARQLVQQRGPGRDDALALVVRIAGAAR